MRSPHTPTLAISSLPFIGLGGSVQYSQERTTRPSPESISLHPVHSISPYFFKYNLIKPTHFWVFQVGSSLQVYTSVGTSKLSRVLHAQYISYSLIRNLNSISYRLQNFKILSAELPSSYYQINKYSPHYPSSKHPRHMFLPYVAYQTYI